MRRRLHVSEWERPGPALARQTERLLALLDELEARATFFVLGMAARSHPGLIEAIAARGHELACHGDRHQPVNTLTPGELRADLRAARATIESLGGGSPIGYRAPAFSITRSARWAYDVIAEEGFLYDSSQHDSPRIRGRIQDADSRPHALALAGGGTLWEFPLAVWRRGGARVPVGGASYWAVLPTRLIVRGLSDAGPLPGVYLHPHELDPEPLRVELSASERAPLRARARVRELQRNSARWRAEKVLRAIAEVHPLITYGEAHAELSASAGAGAQALSRQGQGVRRSV